MLDKKRNIDYNIVTTKKKRKLKNKRNEKQVAGQKATGGQSNGKINQKLNL